MVVRMETTLALVVVNRIIRKTMISPSSTHRLTSIHLSLGFSITDLATPKSPSIVMMIPTQPVRSQEEASTQAQTSLLTIQSPAIWLKQALPIIQMMSMVRRSTESPMKVPELLQPLSQFMNAMHQQKILQLVSYITQIMLFLQILKYQSYFLPKRWSNKYTTPDTTPQTSAKVRTRLRDEPAFLITLASRLQSAQGGTVGSERLSSGSKQLGKKLRCAQLKPQQYWATGLDMNILVKRKQKTVCTKMMMLSILQRMLLATYTQWIMRIMRLRTQPTPASHFFMQLRNEVYQFIPYIKFEGYCPFVEIRLGRILLRFRICVGELFQKVIEFPLASMARALSCKSLAFFMEIMESKTKR